MAKYKNELFSTLIIHLQKKDNMEATIDIYRQDRVVSRPSMEVKGRSCNMAGSGPNKNNQDAYTFATCMFQGKRYMVIVMCDGHGMNGELFAGAASKELSGMVIIELADILQNPQHVLTTILATCNEHLHKVYGDINGGTTVSILIKTAGREIVANLGDCDVYTRVQSPITEDQEDGGERSSVEVICERDGVKTTSEFTGNDTSSSKSFKLSEDHGGTSDADVLRINAECPDCTLIFSTPVMNIDPVEVCIKDTNEKVVLNENGKIKRVAFETVPGIYANTVDMDIATYFVHVPTGHKLNIARSLGDFGYHFISIVPSVTELTYPVTCPSSTIIGTDGYFNCVKKTEMWEQLKKTPQEICDEAINIVDNTFGCKHADNMTVVVINMTM